MGRSSLLLFVAVVDHSDYVERAAEEEEATRLVVVEEVDAADVDLGC